MGEIWQDRAQLKERRIRSRCPSMPGLELQPGIVLAGQRSGAGKRRCVTAEGRVVENSRRAMIRQDGVVMIAALAGERFGAGIEVRALLDDDPGARPAVFVA